MLPSCATPQASKAWADKHADLPYAELGNTGLMVSRAGFGCYRVDDSVTEHHLAIQTALKAGINLIDTSSNYSDGGSERLVGRVLAELTEAGKLSREQVVVVSKVGYLQGSNLEAAGQRGAQGKPYQEVVPYGEGLEHCLHPEFLADQLSASLERLGLERLDVLLLHNPEYYLGWAKGQGIGLPEARQEYYRRIGAAFAHLETEAAQGRIGCYGISSNTFPAPAEDAQFTSLSECWRLAQDISPEHKFRVIEFPFNLLEPGAATTANQPEGKTLLDMAYDHNLGVLINRPLNAVMNERLLRLAEFNDDPPADGEITKSIGLLAESEAKLKQDLLPPLGLATQALAEVEQAAGVAAVLQSSWDGFQGLEHWHSVQTGLLVPSLTGLFQFLVNQESPAGSLNDWVREHAKLAQDLMNSLERLYQSKAAQVSARVKLQIRGLDRNWDQAELLSQMAIRALRSTSGVTSVLVGMRRQEYVEDVLAELRRPVEQRERLKVWRKLS